MKRTRIRIKKIFTTILFTFTLCLISSCNEVYYNNLDDVKRSKILSISTNAEFAPFEYYEKGKVKGFDIDLINAYCEYIGVKSNILDMDFDAMLLYAYKGKSDCAISAITKNSKREEVFTFSNSYFKSSQVIVVLKNSKYLSLNNKDEILNELSKDQAKIGCQRGTTSEYFILGTDEERMEGIENTTCVTFDTTALAIRDLNEGRLDAVICDDAPLKYILDIYQNVIMIPEISLIDEEMCVVFGKDNFTLVNSFNEFLSTNEILISNLKDKYFGENYGE